MLVTEEKKVEFWNHFTSKASLKGLYGYSGHPIGKRTIAKAKESLWNNDMFWSDIVLRHGGLDRTPEQMMSDSEVYYHCHGNFVGELAKFG